MALVALDIEQREREGITILDLKGRITVGPEATALREKVAALNAAGTRNLVLNLAGTDYIDSTGLGALVMCATTLRKSGGNMKLLNLNRRNIELLVMTKLATVFEIFNDEQDAVNSYYPDRKLKTFDILDFVQQMKKRNSRPMALVVIGGVAAGLSAAARARRIDPAPGNRGPGERPGHFLWRLRAAVFRGRARPRGPPVDRLHARVFPQGAQHRGAHRARAWSPSRTRAAKWRSNPAAACATTTW